MKMHFSIQEVISYIISWHFNGVGPMSHNLPNRYVYLNAFNSGQTAGDSRWWFIPRSSLIVSVSHFFSTSNVDDSFAEVTLSLPLMSTVARSGIIIHPKLQQFQPLNILKVFPHREAGIHHRQIQSAHAEKVKSIKWTF